MLHCTESTPSSSASLSFLKFFIVLETSAKSTIATKVNVLNNGQWAIAANTLPHVQFLLTYESGEMCVPRRPVAASTSDGSSTTTPASRDHRDTDYNFFPQSTVTSYLNQFYHFLHHSERWQMINDKACGPLTCLMESMTQIRYRYLTELK
jgi:hypothetical protein